jgi:hypothetical protein
VSKRVNLEEKWYNKDKKNVSRNSRVFHKVIVLPNVEERKERIYGRC